MRESVKLAGRPREHRGLMRFVSTQIVSFPTGEYTVQDDEKRKRKDSMLNCLFVFEEIHAAHGPCARAPHTNKAMYIRIHNTIRSFGESSDSEKGSRAILPRGPHEAPAPAASADLRDDLCLSHTPPGCHLWVCSWLQIAELEAPSPPTRGLPGNGGRCSPSK